MCRRPCLASVVGTDSLGNTGQGVDLCAGYAPTRCVELDVHANIRVAIDALHNVCDISLELSAELRRGIIFALALQRPVHIDGVHGVSVAFAVRLM